MTELPVLVLLPTDRFMIWHINTRMKLVERDSIRHLGTYINQVWMFERVPIKSAYNPFDYRGWRRPRVLCGLRDRQPFSTMSLDVRPSDDFTEIYELWVS